MRILVDTNVILDILLERKEFLFDSESALELAMNTGDILYFSSGSITDVYYLVHRKLHSKVETLNSIILLLTVVHLLDVNSSIINLAINSHINDFEDAVIESIAFSSHLDLILTRNKKDYANSRIRVLTPLEYLLEKGNLKT